MAMTELGGCYYDGRGVAKNEAKAFEWMEKGARAGDTDAMGALGGLYASGTGVAKDEVKAFEWFEKCARMATPWG